MSKRRFALLTLSACVLAPLLQGAAPAAPLGEIVGDDIYVNCQLGMAAQFPKDPKIRNVTYRDAVRTAPAQQFY